MCGIVGYVGAWNAAPVLLSGLSRLEYRGYDSAGIAVSDLRDGENRIEILKAKGRLQALKEMTDNGKAVSGTCGIGHTRWATHGEPSVANAHPHCSKDKRIVVVHNGIIENYKELKEYLQALSFCRRQTPRWWPIFSITIIKAILWRLSPGLWAVSAVPMRWVSFSKTSREKFMRCGKTAR